MWWLTKNDDMSEQTTRLAQVDQDNRKNVQGDCNRFSSTKKDEQSEETVADIVQSLPSFTETQADGLILPSLHMANRELRRAKGKVQKWERICAALRELNKHRDIVRQITDSSRRVVLEK
ncbi:DUF1627 domain-containing protein [Escherichia coli]|uniref:DUF1627 domain-containing protein n=2 Tax=Escherichia coli TaxID=562 RepID=UPI003EBDC426